MKLIYLIDVTNRDGVQTSRIGLAKLEKTMVNLYLDSMGVWQSEFGFPTTRHETNYLNANLELAAIGAIKGMRLSGWIRAIKDDVESAFKLVPKLKYLQADDKQQILREDEVGRHPEDHRRSARHGL